MNPIFDERKTTQVASAFLRFAGGTLNYMKLIRLMYLADRTALLRFGRPITWDSYFLMRHGPVLSTVLDLILEQPNPKEKSFWAEYVSSSIKYSVSLIKDCPPMQLSFADESVIAQVYKDYGSYGEWDLVELLHHILPEWKNLSGSSVLIQYRDILEACGKSLESIEEIEREIERIGEIEKLMAIKN
jgi:uncharacterized phage-associated protein